MNTEKAFGKFQRTRNSLRKQWWRRWCWPQKEHPQPTAEKSIAGIICDSQEDGPGGDGSPHERASATPIAHVLCNRRNWVLSS